MIRIEQKFTLDAHPADVWTFLTDPFQVAGCLPGAEVTERLSDGSYAGTFSVKVGPLTVTYKGKIRFERLDAERMEAELVGQGLDVKGKGAAELRMTSRVLPLEGGGSEVLVASDVSLRGLLAQMGRGMIDSVSARIFQEFTSVIRQKLAAGPRGAPGAAAEVKPLNAASLACVSVVRGFGRVWRRLTGGAPGTG